jgi:hypothetical protein
MSRIDKLRGLLARVEQRRAEPRLVAVSGHGASSANTNVAPVARTREAPLELAPKVAVSREASAPAPVAAPAAAERVVAVAPAPSSMPPPPLGGPETKLHSSLPPPARTPAPADASQTGAPSSTIPPAANAPPAALSGAAHDAQARSTTEILPAVPTRIAPSPALPFDSAVRVTTQPRIETAKTFGELLEQSLALRPKSG